MSIRTESHDGRTLLHIEGEMTIYTAADLKAQLMPHLGQDGELEIVLADVCEIDSAGLQLLILAKREASRNETALRLSRMRPAKSSTQPRKAKTWCALKFKWAPVLAL